MSIQELPDRVCFKNFIHRLNEMKCWGHDGAFAEWSYVKCEWDPKADTQVDDSLKDCLYFMSTILFVSSYLYKCKFRDGLQKQG